MTANADQSECTYDTTEIYKYWAFISYASEDGRAWAAPLLRRIEAFRVPEPLIGHEHHGFAAPKRLRPLFRDRNELSAGPNLPQKLKDALEQSRYLIVICSPRSRESHFVGQEIRWFKELGRANRILLYLVDGEPDDSFHDALATDESDSNQTTMPLAADARPEQDGKDAALRLIAGMLGVAFDGLKQREQKRQQRRLALALAATTAILAIVSGLGILAEFHRQRAEANFQKANESFDVSIGMIRDVTFTVQDQLEITPASAAARRSINATILQGVERLRQIEPERDEVDFMSAHAQMDMSMIIATDGMSDVEGVAPGERYAQLLEESLQEFRRLAESEPSDVQYQRDLSWAARKLAVVQLGRAEFDSADALLDEGLKAIKRAASIDPRFRNDVKWTLLNFGDASLSRFHAATPEQQQADKSAVQNALSLFERALDVPATSSAGETLDERQTDCSALDRICDSYLMLGQPENSRNKAKRLIELRQAVLDANPSDSTAARHLTLAHFKLANALVDLGEFVEAVARYKKCLSMREKLLSTDPGNVPLLRQMAETHGRIGSALMNLADYHEAIHNLESSNRYMEEVVALVPPQFRDAGAIYSTHYRIGQIYLKLGEARVSLQQFRKAHAVLHDFSEEHSTAIFEAQLAEVSGIISDLGAQVGGD